MNLFHATPAENVLSILREGLVGTEEWGDDEDSLFFPPRVHPRLVHVMESAEDARSWVALIHQLEESEVRVFQIDVAGLEILPGLDGPPAHALLDRVDPRRLTLLL